MSKNTNIKIVLDHDAVIDLSEQNSEKDTSDAFNQLANSVRRAIAFYQMILTTLFVKSGMAKADYEHMRGGTFYGLLSKADHVLFYAGKRNYPSSAYCSFAFGLKYLHRTERLAEYRETNTAATMIGYHQWLQVMYADAIDPKGEWCGLSRKKNETIAKYTTVKATEEDKANGKSFHSASLKSVVAEKNENPIPTGIRTIAQTVAEMSPQKLRIVSADYEMVQWSQEAVEELMTACMAQWTINNNKVVAAKEADKNKKKLAKSSK